MEEGQGARRIVLAWHYRPGPDVADQPPPGLVRAQHIAKGAAMAGLGVARAGISEQEVELVISDYLIHHDVKHVWTITNVGIGENAKICFPTHPPTALRAGKQDVVIVDVHPITGAGFWGDCSRCAIIGNDPQARLALADLEKIHHELLRQCRPGMRANELFSLYAGRLAEEGYVLLDKLGNVGHSLTAGAAYLQQFIDGGNETPMWAAWAIEPFAAREDIAVKIEDVVWFGRDDCVLL